MHPLKRQGIETRQKILAFLRDHPGATYQEIARALNMTTGGVREHMIVIKSEWRSRCASQASTLKRGDQTQLSLFNLSEHERAMRGSLPPCSKPTGSPE